MSLSYCAQRQPGWSNLCKGNTLCIATQRQTSHTFWTRQRKTQRVYKKGNKKVCVTNRPYRTISGGYKIHMPLLCPTLTKRCHLVPRSWCLTSPVRMSYAPPSYLTKTQVNESHILCCALLHRAVILGLTPSSFVSRSVYSFFVLSLQDVEGPP